MKLTVLGNAGRYLAPLSGGSSYLLEHGGTCILLDAGPGARDALAATGVERLDAVWLSHFHHDHVLDLPSMLGAMDGATRMWLPAGEKHRLDALARAYSWEGGWETGVPLVEIAEGAVAEARGVRVSFARSQHSAPAFAARFEAGGRAFVYASDTAPCDGLRRLAKDADLLLMHTLLPTVDSESDHARIHSTAETAGALATDAGAKRLLLSHRYWESGDAAMREAAARWFTGVELASDGGTYEV